MNRDVQRHPSDEQFNREIKRQYERRFRDPITGREWAAKEGECPRCGNRALLYQHVSKRTWRCGSCLPKERRALG